MLINHPSIEPIEPLNKNVITNGIHFNLGHLSIGGIHCIVALFSVKTKSYCSGIRSVAVFNQFSHLAISMSTVLDLDEIELHRTHLSEGLNAILSSVLFLRGPVRQRVRDVCCDFLSPLVYPGYEDPSIRTAIDNVLELSTFIGPSLYRCRIGLDFFFIKESSSLFGFVKRNEKVVLESWRLPLILNDMATLDEEPVLMIPK